MKINTRNAAKLFFSSPSLEMVYFEAVANSIDSGSSFIEIKINIESYSKPETLRIEIIDNGNGFEDKNFEKFSKLLEIEEEDHKGIGRLVFLNYFKKVDVSSVYLGKKRTFIFNDKFDGENKIVDVIDEGNKTTLVFTGYLLEKVKSYDYIKPEAIKKSLLFHFFPLFYSLKIAKKDLRIKIKLETKVPNVGQGFFSDNKEIIVSEIHDLESETFKDDRLDLFEELNLLYSIKENLQEQTLITAICVDGRTIAVDVLSKEATPPGYEIIFLLYSNIFKGKVNLARQELTLNEAELKTVKKVFSEKISVFLKEKIPKIQERNKEISESLVDRFPHLQGYFEEEPVGIIDRNQALELAQAKFFTAQKEILDSEYLSEEQYQKSLEISSRILTEYILYRNLIINKLKKIDHISSEADIHNIIIPMRKIFSKGNFIHDLYTNNAWLLDDKYMSYTTILSDKEMDKVVQSISIDSKEGGDDRPDIAIVFSDDPNKNNKVDVVIVELKKLNLKLERKNDIVVQLISRATKLLQHYPDKIQRIWFYGIIDIDKEFKLFLKGNGFTELYSNDAVLYKPQDIYLDEDKKIPIGIYIQSFDAFIKDAEIRNSTFLNILKEGLKKGL